MSLDREARPHCVSRGIENMDFCQTKWPSGGWPGENKSEFCFSVSKHIFRSIAYFIFRFRLNAHFFNHFLNPSPKIDCSQVDELRAHARTVARNANTARRCNVYTYKFVKSMTHTNKVLFDGWAVTRGQCKEQYICTRRCREA